MNAPCFLTKEQWPPNYTAIFAWRQQQLTALRSSKLLLKGAIEYYRKNPVDFICHWVDTFDPRNAGKDDKLVYMPFILFKRQAELIEFLEYCRTNDVDGLIEKCRDFGATWACCGYTVWQILFIDGSSTGWGSRKEQLVDKLGDMDSIFEKIRSILRRIPDEFYNDGFNPYSDKQVSYMRVINPVNGSSATGEAGDNIGRGGRKTIYFKDESAHYPHPESIEAALSDNTRVQIDLSSVNGPGNIFHRRREAGIEWQPGTIIPKGRTAVFICDWKDHPEKTQEWYDTRRLKYESEGLLHLFAQEVDRNYYAAVTNNVIDIRWVKAAIDAHIKLDIDPDEGNWSGAQDVADGGGDRNAFAGRQGIILKVLDEWGAPDTGNTARRAVGLSKGWKTANIMYDCIGVGAGVKAEINRLKSDDSVEEEVRKLLNSTLKFIPWNAGDKVQKPYARLIEDDKQSPLNKDFYHNLKAQAWWDIRNRFYRTYRAITEGIKYNPDQLISIDSNLPYLHQLEKELTQVTHDKSATMKLLIEKTPEGNKSPNLADAVVMCYFPVDNNNGEAVFGVTSGAN